jgi:putative ABC transport system substrate-binding protein
MKAKNALAAALAALLALCSCSSPSDGGGQGEGEKIVVAIVQPMEHTSLNEIRDTIVGELTGGAHKDSIEIVVKNASGDLSLLPSIMQDLIAQGVDIIIPIATQPAQAAKSAAGGMDGVKIVFSAVSNPVEAGLVASIEAPESNITGVSDAIAVDDILKLAKELTPDAKTFGFVYNPSEVNSSVGIQQAKDYCQANSLSYLEATISSTGDINQAVASLAGRVDAFFASIDNTVASVMGVYSQLAIDAKTPIYASADSMVRDGALATVGIDYKVLGRQTAAMAERLIEGQSVSQNPVEVVSEVAKMINVSTAQRLGLTIPESLDGSFIRLGE